MAADPQPHDAQPNDLFGRWLAHHEQQTDPMDTESAGSLEGAPETTPVPRVSRRLPAAAVASSAVERDPVIGARIAPPSNFGARRTSASSSSSPATEPDREPPPGWEPIIMRSVRKKTEQTEARHGTPAAERPSRLQRFRARLVEPAEPTDEPGVEDVPVTPPVVRTTPVAVPPPTPAAHRAEEPLPAAVTPLAEPVDPPTPVRPFVEATVDTFQAPPIEPAPTQGTHTPLMDPVEVPAAGTPEPPAPTETHTPPIEPVEIPAARAPEPTAVVEREPVQRRSLLSRTRRAPRDAKPGARAVHSGAPATTPVVTAATREAPVAEPEAVNKPAKVSRHDEVATEMPGTYTFAPKRSARRLLTLVMLAGLAASAYFVRAAVESRETAAIGLAAIVVLATAMVWAIRAGASVTTLTVHQGQLEVIQQGARFIFDMASEYTQVEVHGQPGKRGWKVLFPRRGMPPFTIDATMVDPDDFMRVLRFFRPNLVRH